jgi:hypothetical protein
MIPEREKLGMTNETDTDALLNERESTHGPYSRTAEMAQAVKAVFSACSIDADLTCYMHESLDQIASKLARIFAGNSECLEHWSDIAGYAELVVRELNQSVAEDKVDGIEPRDPAACSSVKKPTYGNGGVWLHWPQSEDGEESEVHTKGDWRPQVAE